MRFKGHCHGWGANNQSADGDRRGKSADAIVPFPFTLPFAMRLLSSLLLLAALGGCAVHPAAPWQPDQGDGTYRNPVLHADYSDPDAIRVGDRY